MRTVVCIIGKPNVGKSTLFNKIIGKQVSIIMDTPGVTRDRIYGNATYNDKELLMIDTGGISTFKDDFNEDIKTQAEIAINDANVIIFVVDGRQELTRDDYEVRDMLIKTDKKVIVAVNKLDNKKLQDELIYNFYELGFEHVIGISATHNMGISDLMNEVTKDLKDSYEEIDNSIKFSIIGRPNVGKSSLINALVGEERSIVSDIAGTTRDAIDTKFKYNGEDFTVIDTAGMRKRGKIFESIEKYSLLRSFKAIERSDVCVVVINAQEGIIEHDKHIISYAKEAGKALLLVINKWDLINDKEKEKKNFDLLIENDLQFIPYVNSIYLSAKTKKGINKLMPEIIRCYENTNKEIPTSQLNECIRDAYMLHMPPSYKGRRLKIYFVKQSDTKPPKFTFNVNDKKLIHFSYERYLENKLRATFDLIGTPIILKFKNKDEDDE